MTVKFLGGGGSSVSNFGPDATGRTFAGKAPPGASVAVLKNGTQDGTATADASGLWTYTFAAAPAAGDAVLARALVSSTAYTVPAPVVALGPTAASFTAGAAAGSLIAAITGLSAGETVTSVAPDDGRVAIQNGNRLVVGGTASSAGTVSYTLTTSAGRTLTLAATASTIPSNALTLNGEPLTLGGEYLTLGA